LFGSSGDLTPDAAGHGSQLYRYEAPSEAHPAGVLIRITVGEDGLSDSGNAAEAPPSVFAPVYDARGPFPIYEKGGAHASPQAVAISSDGSRVFFRSPLALTRGALNDVCVLVLEGLCEAAAYNFYEWEGGRVFLLSDGQDTHTGLVTEVLVGGDPSGDDVFFTSTDPLVPQDGGTQTGIVDARVDGGFPAPPVVAGCQGEGCQGAPPVVSVFGAPGTATFSGPGDLSAPAPVAVSAPPVVVKPKPKKAKGCRKGFVRKHGRCVRQKSSRQARKTSRGRGKR
jgi:hypothetical protein